MKLLVIPLGSWLLISMKGRALVLVVNVGGVNATKASEGKEAKKRKGNTKGSSTKEHLDDFPELTPSKSQLLL